MTDEEAEAAFDAALTEMRAHPCYQLAARVVELETALRDLLEWGDDRWDDRTYADAPYPRSLAAARRVLGDRPTEETK